MKQFGFLSLVLALLMTACRHETLIPGGTPPNGITPPTVGASTICFETNVLPIFVSNCAKAGCHDAISKADGLRYDNYGEIMNTIRPNRPDNSDAWEAIMESRSDKRMPKPPAQPLKKAQKDSIYKWIVQGALNTTNCSKNCDTTLFTYTGAVLPTLQSSCIGCHSGTPAAGNVDLSTYANVRAVSLSGLLLGVISHTSGYKQMPQGGNKLPDCKITQIRKWIEAGAQNN